MNKPACDPDNKVYECDVAPCQDCPMGIEPTKLRAVLDSFNRDDLPVIYISGPMSGYPEYNFPNFNEAARRLRYFGFPVINPADFGAHPGKNWRDCLVRDLATLGHADLVMLLVGWDDSKGAGLEFDVACQLGIPCVESEDFVEKVLHYYFDRDYCKALHALDKHRQNLVCVLGEGENAVEYAIVTRYDAATLLDLNAAEAVRPEAA